MVIVVIIAMKGTIWCTKGFYAEISGLYL